MRIASILLSILLIASILPGCCTKYKKIVEDQESLLSVNKTLISDLEGTQRELQKKLTENDALMKELQEKLTGDDAFVKELQKEVGSLEGKNKILVQQIKGNMFITLPNSILFSSGSANLREQGTDTLKTICQVLERYPDRPICVEGHTDDVLIGATYKERYATNWELSAARAIQVMHYMVGHFKIKQEQLSVKGYGPFKPIASNTTPEGKAENRRVVIVVGPKTI